MYLDNLLSRYINYTMNFKSGFLVIYCNGGSNWQHVEVFNEIGHIGVVTLFFKLIL
jgi:hypothetical protein